MYIIIMYWVEWFVIRILIHNVFSNSHVLSIGCLINKSSVNGFVSTIGSSTENSGSYYTMFEIYYIFFFEDKSNGTDRIKSC